LLRRLSDPTQLEERHAGFSVVTNLMVPNQKPEQHCRFEANWSSDTTNNYVVIPNKKPAMKC